MITDWRGQPITVGCHIVYPTRSGSSAYVTEARVDEIDPLVALVPFNPQGGRIHAVRKSKRHDPRAVTESYPKRYVRDPVHGNHFEEDHSKAAVLVVTRVRTTSYTTSDKPATIRALNRVSVVPA